MICGNMVAGRVIQKEYPKIKHNVFKKYGLQFAAIPASVGAKEGMGQMAYIASNTQRNWPKRKNEKTKTQDKEKG